MRILNILVAGGYGGIEVLCNNIDMMQKEDNYWCFLFDGGDIADKIKKRNPKKTFILRYKKTQINKFIKKISKICLENKIDIVALQHGGLYCNLLFTYLKKKNPNIKFVKFLHACYEEKYSLRGKFINDKMNIYYLKKTLKNCDLIVSVSEAVQKSYDETFKLQDNKKVIIYNGIGKEFFEDKALRREKTKGEHYEIIYIGRLTKTKGVDRLIKAISQLSKYNIKLTVVGDGEEREKLEALAKNLNLTSIVEFTGFQSDIIPFLDNADIFVYPSVWEEAFGISVAEAMARGCIPIVANKGGLPEVTGNTKYLFSNEEELKNKIESILKKGITKQEIESIEQQAKKFKIEKTIEKLENEYRKLI